MKKIHVFLLIFFLATFVIKAAIRMTDDIQPNAVIYKLKDVEDGAVSFRTNDMDEDNEYEVGDIFMLAEVSCKWVGGTQSATISHRYIVLSKKRIRK